jgi:hypothetical protein
MLAYLINQQADIFTVFKLTGSKNYRINGLTGKTGKTNFVFVKDSNLKVRIVTYVVAHGMSTITYLTEGTDETLL